MYKITGRSGFLAALTEQADFVAYTRAPEFGDAQPGVDVLGKRQFMQVPAHALGANADHVVVDRVEFAFAHEILADNRVEIRVIDDVVDVMVHVDILPARGYHEEMGIVVAAFNC